MPTTLTALFATAIHEARNPETDPTGVHRVAAMLVTATGARRLAFVVEGNDFWVNDVPIPPEAPGRGLLRAALAGHATARLLLPAGLTARQWRDLAEVYASSPGLYPTAEHVRAAVIGLVPGATFESPNLPPESGDSHDDDGSRGRVLPGHVPAPDAAPTLAAPDAERATLSTQLRPLLDAGADAAGRGDWNALADALQQMHELAHRSDEATRAIIAQERRRVVPAAVLEQLVQRLPKVGAGSRIAQALTNLGADCGEAILDVLEGDPSRTNHRTYLDILVELEGVDRMLVAALESSRADTLRDVVEVIGRRRMVAAVPKLTPLLRHDSEQVRTAAWHALEGIGTPEAVQAISRKR